MKESSGKKTTVFEDMLADILPENCAREKPLKACPSHPY
jgi:hypothetical protein